MWNIHEHLYKTLQWALLLATTTKALHGGATPFVLICQHCSRTPPFDQGARSWPFHRLPWPQSTVPTDSLWMQNWESVHGNGNKHLGPSNLNSIKGDQPIEISTCHLLHLLDWSKNCNDLCPKMCRLRFYSLPKGLRRFTALQRDSLRLSLKTQATYVHTKHLEW